jgi:hypothetical protein
MPRRDEEHSPERETHSRVIEEVLYERAGRGESALSHQLSYNYAPYMSRDSMNLYGFFLDR